MTAWMQQRRGDDWIDWWERSPAAGRGEGRRRRLADGVITGTVKTARADRRALLEAVLDAPEG
jgi:hypothetical protein